MEVQRDFEELLKSFNAREVAYLIVGAHAVAFHGAPRYTGDLDVLVRPDIENARQILAALSDFGFASLELTVEDFTVPGRVVQLGVPPVRVDITTSITGVTWDEAYDGKVAGNYGSVPVHYLGRAQFVINKKALSRRKDLADLEALGEG